MSSKRLVSVRASLLLAAFIVAVPAFVCGVSASGQKLAGTPATAAGSAKPVAEAAPGTTHGGVVVHGQWKIVVKNADGTVASTTQFENSLVDNGFLLEHLMLGSIVTGTWGISVSPGSGGTSPCTTSQCLIVTSTTSGPGQGLCSAIQAPPTSQTTTCYGGLAYLVTSTPTFQLSGQFTAPQAGTITSVSTQGGFCATDTAAFTATSTISPASCSGSTSSITAAATFTSAIATSTPAFAPVSVTSGQTVQITVAISLS